MTRQLFRAALVLTLVAGCTTPERALGPRLQHGGGLQYLAATDASGVPVLEGRISLTMSDDSVLSGAWDIHWRTGADTTAQVGDQVGTGELLGRRFSDRLEFDLHPGNYDNNLLVTAWPTSDGFRGEWTWSTIAGPAAHGTFRALGDESAPAQSIDAVVRRGIMGGCWVLDAGDTHFQALDLPPRYRADGLRVHAVVREASGVASYCMQGTLVDVEEISQP